MDAVVSLQGSLFPGQVQSSWVWQELYVIWILDGFLVVSIYHTILRTGPGPGMTAAGVSASHQNEPNVA